jgi:hypothetical protein
VSLTRSARSGGQNDGGVPSPAADTLERHVAVDVHGSERAVNPVVQFIIIAAIVGLIVEAQQNSGGIMNTLPDGSPAPGGLLPAGTNAVSALVSVWAQVITTVEASSNPLNPGNIKVGGTFAAQASLPADLTAKLQLYPNYTWLDIMARYLGYTYVPGTTYYPPNSQGDPNIYAADVVNGINSAFGLSDSIMTTLATTLGEVQAQIGA